MTDSNNNTALQNALLFAKATKTDFIVEQDYQKYLANTANQTQAQRDNSLNQVLQNNGYDTTADVVNQVLQNPQVKSELAAISPNDAATRFAQDLPEDPTLQTGFVNASNAAANAGNTDAINSFLTQNGYQCTAQQASAAINQQKLNRLASWIDVYQLSVQIKGSGNTQSGPALVVTGPTNVTLGGDTIISPTFKDGTLTWQSANNKSSATITFGLVTVASSSDSTGSNNRLAGTLTLASAAYGLDAGTYTITATGITASAAGNVTSNNDNGGQSNNGQSLSDFFDQMGTSSFWIEQVISAAICLAFTEGLKFLVTRAYSAISGWIKGRSKNAEDSVKQTDKNAKQQGDEDKNNDDKNDDDADKKDGDDDKDGAGDKKDDDGDNGGGGDNGDGDGGSGSFSNSEIEKELQQAEDENQGDVAGNLKQEGEADLHHSNDDGDGNGDGDSDGDGDGDSDGDGDGDGNDVGGGDDDGFGISDLFSGDEL